MTTEAKTYNGWTNYQTWAVKLWLDNDEATQHLQADLLDEAKNTVFRLGVLYVRVNNTGQEIWTRAQATRFTLADLLKQFVEDKSPADEEQPTMYTDLLRSAIDAVNFEEIAAHIILYADLHGNILY